MSARLSDPQGGLEKLEFVASCGRCDGGACGNMILDLPSTQGGDARVAERLLGADAVLVIADAGGQERAAPAAHRLLALE